MSTILRVMDTGAVTAIGAGSRQTEAALRAKIGGFREGRWSPSGEPSVMALVPDEVITPMLQRIRGLLLSPWQERVVALAAEALLEAAPEGDAPLVVMLGLPDPREAGEVPAPAAVWTVLEKATGIAIDRARSKTFPLGRAAMFAAHAAAAALCAAEPGCVVLCGAADSYADEVRVEAEEGLGRTLSHHRPGAGRALGEAAAFLQIQGAERRQRGSVEVVAAATVHDAGHRFGDAPDRGEGIANAIEAVRGQGAAAKPFASVWAGMTGEPHDAKQWGVATLRHRDLLQDSTRLEHPADRIGDAGAGLGALLFVAAHARLQSSPRPGGALLWATSDHGPCGCAVMRNEADLPG